MKLCEKITKLSLCGRLPLAHAVLILGNYGFCKLHLSLLLPGKYKCHILDHPHHENSGSVISQSFVFADP